ncbi:sperm-tail PG-rich repeat-containing protein 2-like [Octopus sinensis]|uniref:Sperm-tail PG-rich repeat-containing protein 2-like n=1 Tax=Octopus sinensis TaxID=2607531 RepID=A0A6P7TLC7_9MOLL|nr:sperm-tail PG-rich repeat-containing protein 2-like [Octopus sinensis]
MFSFPYRFFDNSYKGCHFGNYTSSRGFYSISKVPGPGEYNITCAPSKKAENINTKQTAVVRYEAQIPRYLDAIVKKETKLSTPGPAEYIMKSQFDSAVKPETPFTEHPPFYSQAKRFTKHVNTNPAPGLYNDPRCALERIKKASCMKMSPFGQTSVRFQNDIDAKLLPGPGQYNIDSFGSEIVKKAYLESTRRGIFGSSAPRNMTVVNKDTEHNPGPSHYNVKEKPFDAANAKPSSFFASTTKRHDKPTPSGDVPGPDSYDVSNAFEKSQIHPARAKPRSSQSGFLSRSARFRNGQDFQCQAEKKMVPGPGSYDIKSNITLSQKQSLGKSERFQPAIFNDVPGPGAYELSPMFADTLVKGTFNVNLARSCEIE